jgi:hypothetical protein
MKPKNMSGIYAVIIALLLISFNCGKIRAQQFATPIDYLTYINDEYKKISSQTWDYTCAIAHGGRARKIENNRKELIKTVFNAQKRISKMPDFEGNVVYRDSVLSYLSISYHILTEDYAKVVDMEEIAEQSYDNMEAYLKAQQLANEKLDMANEMVNTQLKVFANSYNITIDENTSKLSQNLTKAGEVFDYYNEIYLIFFKSYKQEAYMINALSKKDVNAFEQNRNSLSQLASEGIKQINELSGFKGDNSLTTACRKMLEFYKTEADQKALKQGEFLMKSDNYEKKISLFKINKYPSEQEVNEYNKMVGEYNKEVNEFNKTNTELNNDRNNLLNAWNNSAKVFLDKHIPAKK